jgi:hypothetical protein
MLTVKTQSFSFCLNIIMSVQTIELVTVKKAASHRITQAEAQVSRNSLPTSVAHVRHQRGISLFRSRRIDAAASTRYLRLHVNSQGRRDKLLHGEAC